MPPSSSGKSSMRRKFFFIWYNADIFPKYHVNFFCEPRTEHCLLVHHLLQIILFWRFRIWASCFYANSSLSCWPDRIVWVAQKDQDSTPFNYLFITISYSMMIRHYRVLRNWNYCILEVLASCCLDFQTCLCYFGIIILVEI